MSRRGTIENQERCRSEKEDQDRVKGHNNDPEGMCKGFFRGNQDRDPETRDCYWHLLVFCPCAAGERGM